MDTKIPFPVEAAHAQLLKDPEFFKVNIDTGNGMLPGMIPAVNRESAIALMDIFAFAEKPQVKGYILSTKADELIVAVPASQYVASVVANTSLRGEPQKVEKPATLPSWDLAQVKPENPMPEAQTFNLEIVVDGVVEKTPITALNKESAISLLTQVTCDRIPRIAGWNLFDREGKLLASVPAMAFIGQLAEKTGIGNKPADPKTAGWRTLPLITPTSEEFSEAITKAKKEGRAPK